MLDLRLIVPLCHVNQPEALSKTAVDNSTIRPLVLELEQPHHAETSVSLRWHHQDRGWTMKVTDHVSKGCEDGLLARYKAELFQTLLEHRCHSDNGFTCGKLSCPHLKMLQIYGQEYCEPKNDGSVHWEWQIYPWMNQLHFPQAFSYLPLDVQARLPPL